MTAHIQSMKSDASIFYNGLTVLERKENLLYRVHENSTKNDLCSANYYFPFSRVKKL